MTDLLQGLAAGGDLATIALAVALFKLDRRILSIEMFLKHNLKYGEK